MNPPAEQTRRAVDGFGFISMVLTCLLWGVQPTLLKYIGHDVSPMQILGWRHVLATIVLAPLVWWQVRRGQYTLFDNAIGPGLLIGLMFAVEFVFAGLSLRYTTAAHAAVFQFTSPIFTAIGMHATRRDERLSPLQWAGILLSFAGIALVFLGGSNASAAQAPNMPLGDFLAIMAGAFWGLTTVAVRNTRLAEAPPTKTLLYQLLIGGFPLLLCAWTLETTPAHWTNAALGSLTFQALVIVAASYLFWFWLLRRYLATQLSVLLFLTPLFGMSGGALFLGEPLETSFLIGALLVLLGIFMVTVFQRKPPHCPPSQKK